MGERDGGAVDGEGAAGLARLDGQRSREEKDDGQDGDDEAPPETS
jgi:hypothetical protein